ncbi:hypothetical protein [Actibacterium lipolyticum]|nr:hypothetical protein [Actibacterium lipolyticum]
MKAMTLAALMAAAPFAVSADTLTLSSPLAGGTLHTNAVDMSVYWTQSDDAFEVVAYYVTRDETAPQKLQMRLENGDHVVFGLPGQTGTAYSFERVADALVVTTAPVKTELAYN